MDGMDGLEDLKKKYSLGGSKLIDAVSAYVDLQRFQGEREERERCRPDGHEALREMQASRRADFARKRFLQLRMKDEPLRQEAVKKAYEATINRMQQTLSLLNDAKAKTAEKNAEMSSFRSAIFWSCLEYYKVAQEIKREREYQGWLKRMRKCLHDLAEELAPYEEKVGKLASLEGQRYRSQLKDFILKRDLLLLREKWSSELTGKLRKEIDDKFGPVVDQCDKIWFSAFLLWPKWFKMREIREDTLGELIHLDSGLARLRKKACEQVAVNVAFQWFVEWVVQKLIGLESMRTVVPTLTPDSNLREKVLAIVEYNRIVRMRLAGGGSKRYEAVSQVFSSSLDLKEKPLQQFVT